MNIKACFKKFTLIAGILGLIGAAVLAFISFKLLLIFFITYCMSFAFTGSNFFVMSKINLHDNKRFFAWFAGSFAVRFLGAVFAIIIGLKVLNSHQIFFTVSFLFSYLCHSVIEIIYLNKFLKSA